jgi:hypothetical protein
MDLDTLKVFTKIYIKESGNDESRLEHIDTMTEDQLFSILEKDITLVETGFIKNLKDKWKKRKETKRVVKDLSQKKAGYFRGLTTSFQHHDVDKKIKKAAIEKVKEKSKDKDDLDSRLKGYSHGEKIQKAASKAKKFLKKHKKTIGVAAGVAAAGAAGYYIHKNYLSAAAKACKDAGDKDSCMKRYKAKAQESKIQTMEKFLSLAENTNDPAKFTNVLLEQISKEELDFGGNMSLNNLRDFTKQYIIEAGYSTDNLEQINEASEEQMLSFLEEDNIYYNVLAEFGIVDKVKDAWKTHKGVKQTQKNLAPKHKHAGYGHGFMQALKDRNQSDKVKDKVIQKSKDKNQYRGPSKGYAHGTAVVRGAKAAGKFAKKHKGKIAVGAGIAAAGAAGYMAYKKKFSPAAKACANAPDKKACLAKQKQRAQEAKVHTLEAFLEMANYTNDPQLYTVSLVSRIIQARLGL